MRVLDICCGSGAAAFLAAEGGAEVTALDSSPLLIEQGRTENGRRDAAVTFIQADALDYEFEAGACDLALILGNPFLDFPPTRLGGFRDRVHAALRPRARLVAEYYDGFRNFRKWSDPVEQVTEQEPEEIATRYLGYDPELGAFTLELHNRTRDERCIYHGYVHTIPSLRLWLEPRFALEASHRLADWKFLDVFVKRGGQTWTPAPGE
jgi:SAM-dependent methyltransferase